MKKLLPDYLDAAGAHVLAEKIKRYWHELGALHVTTWVVAGRKEETDNPGDKPVSTWCVRSNLVNGLPPETR
jgi:hypothetical protein